MSLVFLIEERLTATRIKAFTAGKQNELQNSQSKKLQGTCHIILDRLKIIIFHNCRFRFQNFYRLFMLDVEATSITHVIKSHKVTSCNTADEKTTQSFSFCFLPEVIESSAGATATWKQWLGFVSVSVYPRESNTQYRPYKADRLLIPREHLSDAP